MLTRNARKIFVVVVCCGAPAFAQVIISGQTALDNAAAAGARAPGRMVNQGLAQARAAAVAGRAPINITAQPTPSLHAQILSDSIRLIFQQINQAVLLLQNLVLARAGRPPVLPSSFKTSSSTSLGTTAGNLVKRAAASVAQMSASHARIARPVAHPWDGTTRTESR